MKHKLLSSLAALLLLLMICSCSQVFEAGVSGTVKTADGTSTKPVADVNVYAYTNKDQRDSDLEAFKGKTDPVPSSSVYVSKTITNSSGQFTVNKIVWETKKSAYGKTADAKMLYLIFQHNDYDVAAADVTVISDSTNSSAINQILTYNKEDVTLTVQIYDVSSNQLITENRQIKYKISGNDKEDSTTATAGSVAKSIKAPKGGSTITFSLPGTGNDDTWIMCDSEARTDSESLAHANYITLADGQTTAVKKLYMKNTEFTVPGFEGRIIDGTNDYTSDKTSITDNMTLKLWYKVKDSDEWKECDTALTSSVLETPSATQASEIRYSHGHFSGLGSNQTTKITIKDYEGKKMSVMFKISNYDDSKSRTFTYQDGQITTLGDIKLETQN